MLLSVLAEREGASQAEVARSRSARDTRTDVVSLTPGGRAAIPEAQGRCLVVDRQLLDGLPAKDQERLLKVSHRPPAGGCFHLINRRTTRKAYARDA